MCNVGYLIILAFVGLVMYFVGYMICKVCHEHEKFMVEMKKRSDKNRRDHV